MVQRYKKWPTNSEEHAYMRMRQEQNKARARNNRAEAWMGSRLKATGYKWTRQAQWGYRVFDFWNDRLGIAIEVDGSSHSNQQDWDAFRDDENFRYSGILVLRVRNFNEADAEKAIAVIAQSGTWVDRRVRMELGQNRKPAPTPTIKHEDPNWQRNQSRSAVRTIACPACNAPVGEQCQGRRGPRLSNHAERVQAYSERKGKG